MLCPDPDDVSEFGHAPPVVAPGADSRRTDTLIGALTHSLPEFMSDFRKLVEERDDDPGQPMVLMKLADFVGMRLQTSASTFSELERALDVVEAVVDSLADDEIGRELIGLAFFDGFSFEERRLLTRWLGPRSKVLLEMLEVAPYD